MALPVTVIGGFLGAGKTTLVNCLLAQSNGRRIAILVNDFGAISVDARLISSHGGDIIEFANGCVCCSIGDDLSRRLIEFEQQAPKFDHMLIEASGVADPQTVADLIRLDTTHYRLDAVAVIVDGTSVREQAEAPYIADTILRQIAAADLLLVSRADSLNSTAMEALCQWLNGKAPDRPVVFSSHGDVSPEILFEPTLPSPHPTDPTTTPIDHATVFRQWVFETNEPFHRDALLAAFGAMPPSLLRAKGFVRLDGSMGQVFLLQAVGRRAELTPIAPNSTDGLSSSRIVMIETAADQMRQAIEGLLVAATDDPKS